MTTKEPPAMATPVGSSSPTFPPNPATSMPVLPSSPSNSSSPSTSYSLSEGLDLLAMTALEAAGVGKEEKEINTDHVDSGDADDGKPAMVARKEETGVGGIEFGPVQKRRRRSLMPSRYQDSVLQPWKPQRRQRRPAEARRLS